MASVSTSTLVEETYRKTENMYDYVYDNFYSRQAAGEIMCSEMNKQRVVTETVLTPGTVYAVNGCSKIDFLVNYIRERSIPHLGAPPNFAAELDSMKKSASTQSVANVSSEEINILATIGELNETKDMLIKTLLQIKNISNTMREFGRFIRYGSIKNLSQPLSEVKRHYNYYKGLENFWMEMRMGWRPFLFECEKLHSAVTAQKEHPSRQTFRGKTDKLFELSDTIKSDQARVCEFTRSYTNRVTVRAGTICQQRTFGFPDTYGLTKMPQAIWELTKLSWAVDYFFNVGNAIAAYVPDTLWEPLASWYVVQQDISKTIKMVNSYQKDSSFYPAFGGGLSIVTERKVERVPCAYLGIAYFPKLNVSKYLDLVAVGRQYFAKSLKFLKRQIPRKTRKRGK